MLPRDIKNYCLDRKEKSMSKLTKVITFLDDEGNEIKDPSKDLEPFPEPPSTIIQKGKVLTKLKRVITPLDDKGRELINPLTHYAEIENVPKNDLNCVNNNLNPKVIFEVQKKINKDLLKYACDDEGNVRRVLHYYGNILLYEVNDKKWYIWNGKFWAKDNMKTVKKLVESVLVIYRDTVSQISESSPEFEKYNYHSKNSTNNYAINAVYKMLEHHLAIESDKFDSYKDMITVKNGIVNLRTGELMGHKKELFLTQYVDVEFKQNAYAPIFERFVNKIFNNDNDLINYVQTALGYCITGETSQQCVFLAYGSGCNGKSTLINCSEMLFKDLIIKVPVEVFLDKRRSGAASPELAQSKNKRLVYASENEENVQLNAAMIKQLTGSEAISARQLYGNPFEYLPQFKIWIGTNHLPKIKSTDHGTWRRIRVIPFDVTIQDHEKDTTLSYKLEREKEGILRWFIIGAVNYYRLGKLPHCNSIVSATKEYQTNEDTVLNFMQDYVQKSIGDMVSSEELFNTYAAIYPETEGGCSKTTFGLRLKKLGYDKKRKSDGIYYLDIKFIYSNPNEDNVVFNKNE